MKSLFCNRCRKRVIIPKTFMGGNIKVENAIKIKCSDPKCEGHAKYKP